MRLWEVWMQLDSFPETRGRIVVPAQRLQREAKIAMKGRLSRSDFQSPANGCDCVSKRAFLIGQNSQEMMGISIGRIGVQRLSIRAFGVRVRPCLMVSPSQRK